MAYDTVRHALGCHEITGQERNRVSVHLVGRATIIFEITRRCDDVCARLLQRFSGVARFKARQFVSAIANNVS
jgi:hypothetical protein